MTMRVNTLETGAEQINVVALGVALDRMWLDEIENTKDRIIAEFREDVAGHVRVLELALNEAEALAWQSGVPHLVFPALAWEKATAVSTWHCRQRMLWQRTGTLALAA